MVNVCVRFVKRISDLKDNMTIPPNTIHLSDNIEFIKSLPDNSIDSIITDSPYGLGKEPKAAALITDWVSKGYHEIKGTGFMGKKWDAFVPQPALWKECYRVLKPGGYLLSFFGTRTYDWGTLAIRLAGFEIRDCIQWIYGSGFPKGKACLKPANEPICVARKPGPLQMLNIDECRIALNGDFKGGEANRTKGIGEFQNDLIYGKAKRSMHDDTVGRYPSNVLLDEDIATLLDTQSGILKSGAKKSTDVRINGYGGERPNTVLGKFKQIPCDIPADIGGASRFFYVAKASPSERKGLTHPTVKPIKLITQLVKLYTPQGGLCLDPHFGSGTLGVACLESGWCDYIGIDNDPVSFQEATDRINNWHKLQPKTVQSSLFQ